MRAVKKINNNVAVCLDGNGRELIAFGKGIGFLQMPYEVELEKIDRTFYNISEKYMGLINDLPMDVIEFTGKIVTVIQNRLDYELNPNFVLTLADHLDFAMEREKKKIYIEMPLAYDMEQHYPIEMELSRYIIKKLYETFGVKLQRNELSGIAMAIISAKSTDNNRKEETQKKDFEKILNEICMIIEKQMGLTVNKESFDYARFATHMQYLLERIYENAYMDTDNLQMYQSMKEVYGKVSICVDKIIEYLNRELECEITEEEKLYLILHVNRICSKELFLEEPYNQE